MSDSRRLSRSNAKEHLAARDPDELKKLDEAMGYVEQPKIPDPIPETKPARSVQQLLRPRVNRRSSLNLSQEAPMRLANKYSQHLLALAITRFIDLIVNPTGAFENRNENRDLFLVSALQKTGNNFVEAVKLVDTQMRAFKAPLPSIHATIDALCYGVLKQTMFSVWLDYNRALRVEEGVMPDDFFARFTEARPAPENHEVDPDDIRGSADHREGLEQDAPVGLNSDYVTIGGFEWQITGEAQGDNGREPLEPLHNRIAEGLEDLRVYLETVRLAFGVKTDQRLPFFVEQIAGEWVRHDGNVYEALLHFTQKQNERNKQRAVSQDLFFQEQAKRLAASVA